MSRVRSTERTTALAGREALVAASDAALAKATAENFPVAMRILPSRVRAELLRVYTFARFVDDVGDAAPGDRLALLDGVADEIRAVWAGTTSPVAAVDGLRPLIAAHALPVTPFTDLVEANRVDQRQTACASFDDLLDYCRLSAAPIGQLVLHLAGAASDDNLADSDRVCAALQVLEHCQDVGEDARNGRLYLPGNDLARAGVPPEALRASATAPQLQTVVALQVARSRALLASGGPLVRRLSGWSRLAVAGYVAGGQATAHALAAANYDVLGRAIRPSKRRTALIAASLAAAQWA